MAAHLVPSNLPVEHLPTVGDCVKLAEMTDNYYEKFYVTVKELPCEANDFNYVGIVSNQLVYSPLEFGSDIKFKQDHIYFVIECHIPVDYVMHVINTLKNNQGVLQTLENSIVRRMSFDD